MRNLKTAKPKSHSKSVILNAEENYLSSKQRLVHSNPKIQKRFASVHEKRDNVHLRKVPTTEINNRVNINTIKEEKSATSPEQGNNTKLILVEHIKETQ